MKKENSSVAVYMKIRRYMLNFVEQAGERSIQAPTILELSHRFGVSRPTVSKAMKMLTDDGYIIGRPGLGAFTNPAKVNRHQVQHYKNAGILIGDGMLINYSPFYAEQLGRILLGRPAEADGDVHSADDASEETGCGGNLHDSGGCFAVDRAIG